VRVLERRRVLQAVAEETVDADVGEPDQRNPRRDVRVRDDSDRAECDRKDEVVREVVRDRADRGVGGVADERDVWRKDQRREQPPGDADPGVESDRCRTDGEPLEAEEEPDGHRPILAPEIPK
jgi:hypothetical protein